MRRDTIRDLLWIKRLENYHNLFLPDGAGAAFFSEAHSVRIHFAFLSYGNAMNTGFLLGAIVRLSAKHNRGKSASS